MSTYGIIISQSERERLIQQASSCIHDPYRRFDEFLGEAASAFRSLSSDVRRVVREFVVGTTKQGGLLIEGLPIDATLPPTPTHDDGSRYTNSTITEFTMCALASAVGEPVGYAPERWGQLVHNVFPTQGERFPSQRFRTGLGFHTELSCHPKSPDHVLLLCLRQDPDRLATTWLLDVHTLLEHLPVDIVDSLFHPEYALDLGNLHFVYMSGGQRISNDPRNRPVISILDGDRSDPSIRYEPALMTPQTERASRAFEHLATLVPKLATPTVLTPGSALLIDNRRSLHARSTFPAYFDGTDRWLRRMMIAAGPRPQSSAGIDRIIDSDILEGWCDRPTVASLAAAPGVRDTPRRGAGRDGGVCDVRSWERGHSR